MSFDKIVEELIQKAQERGEFDNLPNLHSQTACNCPTLK